MTASGDGSGSITQSVDTSVNLTNKPSTSDKVSYAQMAQQIHFPRKEQAIVTDAIDGLQIKDYVVAIGRLVGPENIRFASRISQGRVCLYLSTQDLARRIVDANTKINIKSHVLTIRSLISNTKRIIISNVCPIIPHVMIEAKFREFNVTPVSPITFIKAGINEAEYSHIMSFRRQMYVKPEDVNKLPSSFQIRYEGTAYWIYVSSDKLACFLCKEEGHLAKHCVNNEPEVTDTQSQENQTVNEPDNSSVMPPLNLENQNTSNNLCEPEKQNSESTVNNDSQPQQDRTSINKQEQIMPPPTLEKPNTPNNASGLKRQYSESTVSDGSQIQQDQQNTNKEKTATASEAVLQKNSQGKKNKKQCTQDEVDEQLTSATDFLIKNAPDYPITLVQLAKFLKETFGSKEIPQIAEKFTTDTSALLTMLRDTQTNLADKTLKGRIGRIVRRLENPDAYDSSASTDHET